MYKPMSLKKTLDMFESVPVIFEAPDKHTQKYLRYRGFSPMNVSSLFSWIRVVLPSSIVEDMMDLLNINKAFVDFQVNLFETKQLQIGNTIALPISYTSQQLGADNFYNMNMLGKRFNVTGKGIKVGVVDTGANRVFSKSVHAETASPLGLYDFNGHGTHVSSTISAPMNAPKYAGIDMHGVAPESLIYTYNAMPIGFANTSDIVQGIETLYRRGVRTINMSLGTQIDDDYKYEDDPLVNFIDKLCAVDKNMLFVVASGNSGPNTLSSPAISPNVISVGSLSYTDKEISYFSSYGEFTLPNGSVRKTPDFVSFGGGRADKNTDKDELILAFTGNNSADLTDGLQPNGFGLMHGTSQATPHATGMFTLMRHYLSLFGKNDNVNAKAIRNLFIDTNISKDEKVGYGLLDYDMTIAIARGLLIDLNEFHKYIG